MTFKTPIFLALIPVVIPLLIVWYWRRSSAVFSFPTTSLLKDIPSSWRVRFRHTPFFMRLIVVTLVLIALAGPRTLLQESNLQGEGVNMALLLDTSTSMAAEDFTINGVRQNRLDVIKSVLKDFISQRTNDRLCLIAFAAKPFTVSPLTADHAWLLANLERVRFGLMEDGTAIGSAIAAGTARLRKTEGKSKVIILLTDGINNAGKLAPLEAAQAAAALGIRIYTIGAGTKDMAPYPVQDLFGRTVYQNVKIEIDEDTLRKIAELTGGEYFRATDTDSLKQVYTRIDQLEKVKFEDNGYRQVEEHFGLFLLLAMGLFFLEVILARTIFLKIP